MGIIPKDNLAYVSEHMLDCRKHSSKKRRVLIKADSNDSGKKLAQIMKTAYPEAEIMDYSGGYRDFSLQFQYVWRRDEVVNEINGQVAAYRNAHPESINTQSADDPAADDPTDEPEKKSTGWTTYIIIGVAVAIIAILLLWDRKKK